MPKKDDDTATIKRLESEIRRLEGQIAALEGERDELEGQIADAKEGADRTEILAHFGVTL